MRMQVIENESVFPFDVDHTLIGGRSTEPMTDEDIELVNPYTAELVYVKPNKAHVDLLKESAGRRRYIIVWSASGALWAQAVIEALELQSYVNLVLTKPIGYVDDQPVSQWMQNHVFLKETDRL